MDDFVRFDELRQFERLLALQLDRIDLLGFEQDVIALLDLIALDDIGPVHWPAVGIGGDHADAVVGVLMQHVEADIPGPAGGGVERHRTAHEGQAQIALPGGTGCACAGSVICTKKANVKTTGGQKGCD